MNKITTAIIPVAGKGIRMAPITKVVPKTMLPINNIPAIQYIIEEAYSEGIKNFIIILNKNQQIIIDYFNKNNIEEQILEYKRLNSLINNITITYIYQESLLGLADAIYYAKNFIKDNECFSVLLGDDIFYSKKRTYGIGSLIKKYKKHPACYIGVKSVKRRETKKYGMAKVEKRNLIDIIEKPLVNPPSNKACVGRYILDSKIFTFIEELKRNSNEIILFTDVLKMYINVQPIYISNIVGNRYDIGCLKDYIKANIKYKK